MLPKLLNPLSMLNYGMTPGINPGAPAIKPPSMEGLFPKPSQFQQIMGNPMMQLGVNLLAQSGPGMQNNNQRLAAALQGTQRGVLAQQMLEQQRNLLRYGLESKRYDRDTDEKRRKEDVAFRKEGRKIDMAKEIAQNNRAEADRKSREKIGKMNADARSQGLAGMFGQGGLPGLPGQPAAPDLASITQMMSQMQQERQTPQLSPAQQGRMNKMGEIQKLEDEVSKLEKQLQTRSSANKAGEIRKKLNDAIKNIERLRSELR